MLLHYSMLFKTFKLFHEEYANGVGDKHIKLLSKFHALKSSHPWLLIFFHSISPS